ncbi:S9 family peptidase, partial [Planococcus sp. SIMBA_143]
DREKVHVVFDPVFTDENTIYFVTDYESEYSYVAKYEIKEKAFSSVFSIEGESVETLKWHKESNSFYLATEKGVVDVLYRYDLESDKVETLSTPIDVIDKLQVTKSGNVYLLGRSATVPPNIFKTTNGSDWEQLTNNGLLG